LAVRGFLAAGEERSLVLGIIVSFRLGSSFYIWKTSRATRHFGI
jgi:hypothetical protein